MISDIYCCWATAIELDDRAGRWSPPPYLQYSTMVFRVLSVERPDFYAMKDAMWDAMQDAMQDAVLKIILKIN